MPTHRIAWLIASLLTLAALTLFYRATTVPTDAVVTVEWTTASELDTAGFNVYRAENPEGPFVRVNDHLIPASPDPLIGGSYVFTDTDVAAGHTYYYQLEDVETSGTTTRHGPVEVMAEGGRRVEMLLAAGVMGVVVLGLGAVGWRGLRRQRMAERISE